MKYSETENFDCVVHWRGPSHVCYPVPSEAAHYHGAWPADLRPSPEAREWQDIWGATWTDLDGEVFPTRPAIPSIHDVGALVSPSSHGPERQFDVLTERVAAMDRSSTFLAVGHPHCLYEKAIEIAGPEEFLGALLCAPDQAHRLLDAFLEFELGIAEEYAKLRPDHVNFGDDYGTQDRLAMAPEVWREFFKPRLRTLIDYYHRNVGEHAVVSLHSCGHIMPILEDLISIGVNILHPVQTRANDLAEARRITSHRLVLAGGIDGQFVLPQGGAEQVREEVFRKLDLLWEDGGYLPMAEKMLGVPQENYDAMVESINEWSREHVENGARVTSGAARRSREI